MNYFCVGMAVDEDGLKDELKKAQSLLSPPILDDSKAPSVKIPRGLISEGQRLSTSFVSSVFRNVGPAVPR